MEGNAEILLARSSAPDSISSDATVRVPGRQGYETAVRGKNGFVSMVERSWMAAFDSPEYWNPKVRGAECLNAPAARSILPIADQRHSLSCGCDGTFVECRRLHRQPMLYCMTFQKVYFARIGRLSTIGFPATTNGGIIPRL